MTDGFRGELFVKESIVGRGEAVPKVRVMLSSRRLRTMDLIASRLFNDVSTLQERMFAVQPLDRRRGLLRQI